MPGLETYSYAMERERDVSPREGDALVARKKVLVTLSRTRELSVNELEELLKIKKRLA